MKPNFCSFCGTQLPPEQQDAEHPHCGVCETTHWQNPKPVAVLLQPVKLDLVAKRVGLGLLVAARAIEPKQGGLALPSGFVGMGETAVQAAAREFAEESGCDDLVHSDDLHVVAERPTPNGHLLTFVQNYRVITLEQVAGLKDTVEAVQWQHISLQRRLTLCFPLHEEVAGAWLKSHDGRTLSNPLWRL